jgi:type III secretory pathway component EscS
VTTLCRGFSLVVDVLMLTVSTTTTTISAIHVLVAVVGASPQVVDSTISSIVVLIVTIDILRLMFVVGKVSGQAITPFTGDSKATVDSERIVNVLRVTGLGVPKSTGAGARFM